MKSMENKLIHYQTDNGIAIIELNNPPANAYSYEMFRELDDAILRARFDEAVHVLVLRGAGDKFFCAGADINMLARVTREFKYHFCLHANETLLRLSHTPKLVIAAIGGHCVGGGLEIALAADIRIAADGKAKFGLPEVALGVLPGTGGTQRLARLIGQAKAIELMIGGRRVDVAGAQDLGLISKVFPTEGFYEQVIAYARGFCPPQGASMAVGHIKRAVMSGADLSLEAGLALERELQQRLFASADANEGIVAYTEKRSPVFTGK